MIHDHGSHDQGGHASSAQGNGRPQGAPSHGSGSRGSHSHGSRSNGSHSHGGLGHAHAPTDFGTRFKVAIALNIAIVVLQAVYGWLANSVALLADAGHNLSDVLGLVVAYGATLLAARPASRRFTYGLGGSSIVAAFLNGAFLLLAVGALSWEAIHRLSNPQPVAEVTVMVVAAIGMVLNGFTAWLFMAGSQQDINIRGAYLHMAADSAVSAGVIVAALVIWFTGWLWLDPATSLLINAVILWGAWRLIRDSLVLSLGAVPPEVDYGAVHAYLSRLEGVGAMHDLHVWPLSTTETALTVHLVMPQGHPGDAFLAEIAASLQERFAIGHATVQIETGDGPPCPLVLKHAP